MIFAARTVVDAPSSARLRASNSCRCALDAAPKTDAQLNRPGVPALRRRLQQVVANQPMVGDLPDFVAGRRPDLDAMSEVLADPTHCAQREFQPGRRDCDRCRDVHTDGKVWE